MTAKQVLNTVVIMIYSVLSTEKHILFYHFTNCSLQDLDILANDNLLLRLKYDGTVDWEPPLLFVTHCEVCVLAKE